jgi:DNA helicase IV
LQNQAGLTGRAGQTDHGQRAKQTQQTEQTYRSEVEREQDYVSRLYARLDELRKDTSARLATVLRESGGTPQARTERDAAFAHHSRRLAQLEAAENKLCFGRLDMCDGSRHYIGRTGIQADSAEKDPLLVDWRAPAARPFYVATAAAPSGVHRRRHIVTRGRTVTGVDDEVLDGVSLRDGDDASDDGDALAGQAALLAAVNAPRGGRMNDIVATLQTEQDAVIRADHRGVLVVQGGPGTGKTAVALHRAAYLLYNEPRLAAQGVLIVGPNSTFLTYIGQVLPGLGETGVLLSTIGELFPCVTPDRAEPPAVAEIKGREAMANVLAAAVREHQVPPGAEQFVDFGGETVHLDAELCRSAAQCAAASGLPHNQARRVFVREITRRLALRLADETRRLAARLETEVSGVLAEAGVDRGVRDDLASLEGVLGSADDSGTTDVLDDEDVAGLRRALRADPAMRSALDALWPPLTPQRLLEELFADPRRLAVASYGGAAELSEHERELLVRTPGGWSQADVPLLDEAAELLGEDDSAERAAEARERSRQTAYAQGVLDIAEATGRSLGSGSGEDGTLTAGDLLDASQLAERHRPLEHSTVSERAAADRTRGFGHVIVDEAQELSQMAWRLLKRRCPSRSMTLAGDVAQSTDAAGTTSWERVLRPLAGDRWRLATLSVNYRTPVEIMDATVDLVAQLGTGTEPPRSVRGTGILPWRMSTTAAALPVTLARLAAHEAAQLDGGQLAVIVPQTRTAELGAAVAAEIPEASFGANPDLTAGVVVLGVRQAKGLEFDSVIVADPGGILTGSSRGRSDLYVAMTRATQRLGLLHTGEPPAEVARAVRELGT